MKKRSGPKALLRLTRQEREALRQLLRKGKTGIWMAARVRVVLLASAELSVSATARELGRDRKWVRRWLQRFQKRRIAGLQDSPRCGRPPKFSPRRAA